MEVAGGLRVSEGTDRNGSVPHMPILTRDQIRREKERRSGGYIFPLTLTGGAAQVRIPNVADKATIARLPRDVQSIVAETLARVGGTAPTVEIGSPSEGVRQLMVLVEDQEKIANEFCILGFIRPRLVRTEEEVDPNDPYCLPVREIHLEDRIAFCELVTSGERNAARALRAFHPGPVDDVPAESGHKAPTEALAFSGPE
jgi:hypothetical protein